MKSGIEGQVAGLYGPVGEQSGGRVYGQRFLRLQATSGCGWELPEPHHLRQTPHCRVLQFPLRTHRGAGQAAARRLALASHLAPAPRQRIRKLARLRGNRHRRVTRQRRISVQLRRRTRDLRHHSTLRPLLPGRPLPESPRHLQSPLRNLQ